MNYSFYKLSVLITVLLLPIGALADGGYTSINMPKDHAEYQHSPYIRLIEENSNHFYGTQVLEHEILHQNRNNYTNSHLNQNIVSRLNQAVVPTRSSNEGISEFYLDEKIVEKRENAPIDTLQDNERYKKLFEISNEIELLDNNEVFQHNDPVNVHMPTRTSSDENVELSSSHLKKQAPVHLPSDSSDTHDHHQEAPMSHTMHMMSFFHQSIMSVILFKGWVTYDMLTYLLSVLCIFCSSLFLQYLKYLSTRQEAYYQGKLRVGDKETFIDKLLRAVLNTVESFLSLLLMLVAMTFNVGLFLAIITGIFVGTLILGTYKSRYLLTLGQGCACD